MRLRLTAIFTAGLLAALTLVIAACGSSGETGDTTPVKTTPTEVTAIDGATPVIADGLAAPAYITFAINVHDTVHVDQSADTILRLIEIYERHGARGDFYLTAPMVALYAEKRPEVIERLRESDMTISYHVRPPHPLYNGFDDRLKDLDDATLQATLRDYETYALDPVTGELDYSRPGGYTYVAETLGRAPVVTGAPTDDQRIKTAAETLYASLGAQVTVRYHEEGTAVAEPFVYVNGLLERPSDFSITRWGEPGRQGKGTFWWNMQGTPKASAYNPTARLNELLAEWQAKQTGRSALITALIHENNFYRNGAEAWTLSYYSDTDKDQPLKPPYDLNAPDTSKPRSAEEQELIWAVYEEMVAWAAANIRVATSEDIAALAEAS